MVEATISVFILCLFWLVIGLVAGYCIGKENKEIYENGQIEITKLCNEKTKYRSALKEIRDYLNTLSSVDSDFPNTETYLRIQDKIGEVLNEGK